MASKKYEIHLKGHLSQDWTDWLDCMEICCLENGEMVLSGLLADQAALLGVLNKLSCLNLCILSVNETGRKGTDQTVCNEPAGGTEC
jgi:hypothetical protein